MPGGTEKHVDNTGYFMKNSRLRTGMLKCLLVWFLVLAVTQGFVRPAEAADVKPQTPKVTGTAAGYFVTLSWPRSANAEGYEILKYQAADRQYHWFKTYKTTKAVTLTLKGKYNCTYRYKIKAFRIVKGKKVYSDYTSVQIKTACSPGVMITSTTRDKTDSGVLRWQANTHADGYEVWRSDSKGGTYARVMTLTGSSKRSWRNSGLNWSKAYYYKVRAFCKNGNSYVYSGFGGVKSIPAYAEPTPSPTPTPLPEMPVLARKLMMVGDSRFLNMKGALEMLGASVSTSINWNFSSWGGTLALFKPQVNAFTEQVDDSTDIVFWLGVNDCGYIRKYNEYIEFYKTYVPVWIEKGARVYIMAVGPLGGNDPIYPSYSNSVIEEFNSKIKEAVDTGLIPGAVFVDAYTYLNTIKATYLTETDVYHYSNDTSIKIFYYILNLVNSAAKRR